MPVYVDGYPFDQEKRDAALVTVDKKGVPGANAGQFILLPGQF